MAHQLGATFHIPHGLANALMISHVIRYNATDTPFKQATFSQYKYPNATWRYARIASYLGLGGNTEAEKVERLIAAVEDLKQQLDIPLAMKDAIAASRAEFYAKLDELADRAFDDQCTGANPRYPLIKDLKQLLADAYEGAPVVMATPEANGSDRVDNGITLKLDPQPVG
jgi:acetaldehyde dehydrogenase/alcohol dehydrogenase